MDNTLHFQLVKPDKSLEDFVYCFTSLRNLGRNNDAVVFPNGKIDLFFSKTADNQLLIYLLGLETKPKLVKQEITDFFAVSFNPLAVEYIFNISIADIVDSGKKLPPSFWDFNIEDLGNFNAFCQKVMQKIYSLLPIKIDERKLRLFELIDAGNGEISIKELSEKVAWSERQINRYFSRQYGLSIKSYCNIVRFQASLEHIKEGRLFPQLNYTDQSHFIKEIKKLSGVSPKELFKNHNDRFLQFLAYNKH